MSHALIIDDNVVLSRAIRNRLQAFGFDSFDYTWAERQAVDAAARHQPDLIVVGDSIADGSPRGVAERLSTSHDAPVLFVTTQSFMLQRQAPGGSKVDGPHLLSDLDQALERIAATAEAA